MASGTWDGIIVTHSSFERIGMSRDYQERFLREQIAEYDQLLRQRRRRHLPRAPQHHQDHREAKGQTRGTAQRPPGRREKDDGLVFDELGVDHIFIDESHYFKNLETPTKMERVAGIQTSGSERAFDLYMKARFLHRQHPGHGVTFATGTPISNTMVEMYTIQRYLDPDGLSSAVLTTLTPGPPPSAKSLTPWKSPRTVRACAPAAALPNSVTFRNCSRCFAPCRCADSADAQPPPPSTAGREGHVIACPMSEAQYAIQESLVAAMRRSAPGR